MFLQRIERVFIFLRQGLIHVERTDNVYGFHLNSNYGFTYCETLCAHLCFEWICSGSVEQPQVISRPELQDLVPFECQITWYSSESSSPFIWLWSPSGFYAQPWKCHWHQQQNEPVCFLSPSRLKLQNSLPILIMSVSGSSTQLCLRFRVSSGEYFSKALSVNWKWYPLQAIKHSPPGFQTCFLLLISNRTYFTM